MKRRILIIGRYVSNYGGAHKYLENLVGILSEAGMQVLVVLEYRPETIEFCQQLNDVGAELVNIPFDNEQYDGNARLLDIIVKEFSPHLIDCEVAAKTVRNTLVKSECMRGKGISKLFTMHLAIKSESPPNSFLDTLNPLSSWNRGLKERKVFLNLFDHGISVSEYHSERIEKLLCLKKNFFKFIPNGVDIDKFKMFEQDSTNGASFIIGGCGSLTRQKRFDLLVNAVAIVAKEYEGILVRIAGEGPEREMLERLVRKHNIQKQVEFCGLVSDTPEFFRQINLFVMCSDNEGFPFALLEAMATGLPSIVTDAGDMSFMIDHGINGVVIGKGSHIILANAMLKMLRKGRGELVLLGENGRKVVEEKYDKRNIDRELVALYQELSCIDD